MYKPIIQVCSLAALLLYSTITCAQTTTIDYLNSGLSTTDNCNVFDPEVNVNDVLHSSYAGGVLFSTSSGIKLSVNPANNSGTAYVINYDFAPGFNYTIEITALGKAAILLKTSVVPNFNQFTTNGTTSCTIDPNVGSYNTVGYGTLSTPTATTSATYTVQQFSIPSGSGTYPYLMIWASGGQAGGGAQVLNISKVVITKTAITSFTLSPATVPLSCGSNSATTFTVTNGNNTPGVTQHTWNLGATPNGWLRNGSAAPATITTGTTNTITLTPVCGVKPNNVFATVTAGGANYTTNTSAVTMAGPPTLSTISGNSIICNSETYSIPGLPCGATVVWSSSVSGVVSLSCTTCPQTTATLIGNPDAFVDLKAAVTSCGVTQNITKRIRCGKYPNYYNVISGTTYVTTNQTYSFTVDGAAYPGITPVSWSWPSGWTFIYGGGASNYIVLKSPPTTYPPSGSIIFNGISCNTPFVSSKTVFTTSSYRMSPNPASDAITIEEMDNATKETLSEVNIRAIEIVDRMGVVVYKRSLNIRGMKRYALSVRFLKNDLYTVRIFNGYEWKASKIIVRR